MNTTTTTTTYRFPPGTPVRYTGIVNRKQGLTGRIVGPHVGRPISGANIRQRETYDVDWGDGIGIEFAGCLTERTMLPTDELREGDIVVDCGMRIRIIGPAKTYRTEHGNHPDVYSVPGLVVNADEVRAVPHNGYIRRFLCEGKPDCRCGSPGKDRWDITGGHLATWHIEPKETAS